MSRDGKGKENAVLVVDDERTQRILLQRWLEDAGYTVNALEDGEMCLDALNRTLPDAICLDLSMPGLSGLEVLARIKATHRFLPVIILTADEAVDTVVAAMQAGAYDYLVKPVDRTKLLTTLQNSIERHQMSMRMTELERESGHWGYAGMVGQSAPMKELFRQMDRVSSSDIPLLIHGESGTGKELVARGTHERSGRSGGPFVAVSCAAIPETLLESELFGHEKGAFTGAIRERRGRLEQANHGTLFLDEVGELGLPLQAKLLRALEERSFRRVGGSSEIGSDFRLIAATHRNLAEDVKKGRFREDLYYRIVVFELEVPALRERGDDILLLADKFLADFEQDTDDNRMELSPEAADLLRSYHWPGNVRELQNAIQRAIVESNGAVVRADDMPPRIREAVAGGGPREPAIQIAPQNSERLPEREALSGEGIVSAGDVPELTLAELERTAIEAALRRYKGNLSEVVRRLGIARTTLYRKLDRYGLR